MLSISAAVKHMSTGRGSWQPQMPPLICAHQGRMNDNSLMRWPCCPSKRCWRQEAVAHSHALKVPFFLHVRLWQLDPCMQKAAR
jgi:hypothetical protein